MAKKSRELVDSPDSAKQTHEPNLLQRLPRLSSISWTSRRLRCLHRTGSVLHSPRRGLSLQRSLESFRIIPRPLLSIIPVTLSFNQVAGTTVVTGLLLRHDTDAQITACVGQVWVDSLGRSVGIGTSQPPWVGFPSIITGELLRRQSDDVSSV